jgi:GMP reductase
MNIENDVKLDFSDVLIKPQRSSLASRKDVDLTRGFTFNNGKRWKGVPIVAANMDSTGTFETFEVLAKNQILTALHKHYPVEQLVPHFYDNQLATEFSLYSLGIGDFDYDKFKQVRNQVGEGIKFVCIDVANGYTTAFTDFIKRFRDENPDVVIFAGNVVTGDMTRELIKSGVDVVKAGIGPGSVCTTRKMTGVGYPQLSCIADCYDGTKYPTGGLICSDGGCTTPGDVSKAFGAGADFVMLGGMLAGHDESGGHLITEIYETEQVIYDDGTSLGNLEVKKHFKTFYGMSSDTAMNKYNGGVAEYRASEGKTVKVPYRGKLENTVRELLGGVRSTCTYIGAETIYDMPSKTTFIRVNRQLNEVFGKS